MCLPSHSYRTRPRITSTENVTILQLGHTYRANSNTPRGCKYREKKPAATIDWRELVSPREEGSRLGLRRVHRHSPLLFEKKPVAAWIPGRSPRNPPSIVREKGEEIDGCWQRATLDVVGIVLSAARYPDVRRRKVLGRMKSEGKPFGSGSSSSAFHSSRDTTMPRDNRWHL